MRGMGMPLACVSSRTMRCSSGYSASVTGLDRVVAMAILSEYQYMAKLKTRAMASAITAPFDPPMSPPIRTKRPPRAAISTQVLTLFTCRSSSFLCVPNPSLPLYERALIRGLHGGCWRFPHIGFRFISPRPGRCYRETRRSRGDFSVAAIGSTAQQAGAGRHGLRWRPRPGGIALDLGVGPGGRTGGGSAAVGRQDAPAGEDRSIL